MSSIARHHHHTRLVLLLLPIIFAASPPSSSDEPLRIRQPRHGASICGQENVVIELELGSNDLGACVHVVRQLRPLSFTPAVGAWPAPTRNDTVLSHLCVNASSGSRLVTAAFSPTCAKGGSSVLCSSAVFVVMAWPLSPLASSTHQRLARSTVFVNMECPKTGAAHNGVFGCGPRDGAGNLVVDNLCRVNSQGQLSQDALVLAMNRCKRNGFYLDVGSADGQRLSNTALLDRVYGWRGVCVDPFPRNMGNRSCRSVQAAVHREAGKFEDFLLAGDLDYGGLKTTLGATYRDTPQLRDRAEVSLFTTTLADVILATQAPAVIDYMSLDVEGAELDALRGFPWGTHTVRVMTVEHNYEEPRRLDVRRFLRSKGYIFVGQLHWDDVFVARLDDGGGGTEKAGGVGEGLELAADIDSWACQVPFSSGSDNDEPRKEEPLAPPQPPAADEKRPCVLSVTLPTPAAEPSTVHVSLPTRDFSERLATSKDFCRRHGILDPTCPRRVLREAARSCTPAVAAAPPGPPPFVSFVPNTRHGNFSVLRGDQYIGHSLRVFGEWSEKEMEDIYTVWIRPGDVVLDVGANVGAMAVPFAQLVGPGGFVHAFEPIRVVSQVLATNLVSNGVQNAAVHHAYVTDEDEVRATGGAAEVPVTTVYAESEQYAWEGRINWGAWSLDRMRGMLQDGGLKERVRLMTIDSLQLDRLDFIKIDTEGHEGRVVRGAWSTIQRFRPVIYAERSGGAEEDEVKALLESAGYTCRNHGAPYYNPENYFRRQCRDGEEEEEEEESRARFKSEHSHNQLCVFYE